MDGGREEAQHHPQPWLTRCKGGHCAVGIKRLLGSEFWAGCGRWCWEAVMCWTTEGGLDSAGLWFLILLWSQVTDSLCSESEDLFWSMISEELPCSQGFPVGTRYLLPAGSEKLQLSVFIIVWDSLSQVPAGGHKWGLVAVSVDGAWTNENILGQITWGQKSGWISVHWGHLFMCNIPETSFCIIKS